MPRNQQSSSSPFYYQPGVTDRTGEIIGGGLADFGRQIADGIEGRRKNKLAEELLAEARKEKADKIAAAGKAADYFLKASGEDETFSKLGVTKEEWKNLPPQHKSAAVTGLLESNTMQKLLGELTRQKQQQEQEQKLQAATAELGRMAAPAASDPRDFLGGGEDDPGTMGREITPGMYLQAMGRHGVTPSDSVQNQLLRLMESRREDPTARMNAEAAILNARTNEAEAKRRANAPPKNSKPATRTDLTAAIKRIDGELEGIDSQAARVSRVGGGDPGIIARVQALKARRAELAAQLDEKMGIPAPAAASAAPASYPTATNPKTGEKLQFKDGQWQPLKP